MESSPGRKIISPNIERDRIVTRFPPPFHPDAAPANKWNFDPQVKDACSQNKTGTVGLNICKAVLVGDIAVGKSCLVNRFCHNVFDREYRATIGVDFEVEKFSILGVPFTLQVWDTAGQERFKCIAASYYRGSSVVIVAFDLSDTQSLANAQKWKEDACESSIDPLVFLVGTKKDLVSASAYAGMEKEAIRVANQIGAEFWAVSSKTGENVKDFFFRVVALTFDSAVMKEIDSSSREHSMKIGTIKVAQTRSKDMYEHNSGRKLKCCN